MNFSKLALIAASVAGASTQAAVLLNEPFTYSNGLIDTVSGGVWSTTSGSGGGVTIVNNAASIDDVGTDDHARALASSASSGTIYSTFTLNISTTDPSTTTVDGAYFYQLLGTIPPATGVVGVNRVFLQKGASGTSNKIGIAGYQEAPTYASSELTTGTTYTIVTRYVFATGVATLFVNPTDETSSSTSSTGAAPAAVLDQVALRINSSSDGDKTLDNLRVATSFAELVPEPTTLAVVAGAALVAFRRRRA